MNLIVDLAFYCLYCEEVRITQDGKQLCSIKCLRKLNGDMKRKGIVSGFTKEDVQQPSQLKGGEAK